MIAAALLMLVQAAAPTRPPVTPAPAPAPVRVVPPPATPQQADARCLVAFGLLSSDPQDEVKRASQLGALYFYGKLVGRNPALDLRAAMVDAARVIGAEVRPELARCGGELQRSGAAMQAVGSAIAAGAPGAAVAPAPVPSPAATPRR